MSSDSHFSQAHQNRSTRGRWDFYSRHRTEIEQLIVPQQPGGKICILGAGNCNDLDLQWAARVFKEVHLFDIDRTAVDEGLSRQSVSNDSRFVIHAPLDLTGIAECIETWKSTPPGKTDIDAALNRLDAAPFSAPAPDTAPDSCFILPPSSLSCSFDLVLSPCVLSQIFLSVRDMLTGEHPDWPRFRAALRRQHLRQMADLLAPGGRGVLVVDLVSSNTLPRIDRAREHEVPEIMARSIRDRKCFHGLEPAELFAAIARDPQLAGRIGSIQVTRPWLWHLSFARAFVVYALTFNATAGRHSHVE